MAVWRVALPLLLAALIAVDDWITSPSCEVCCGRGAGGSGGVRRPEDLVVMVVADLLLEEPETGFSRRRFRDFFTAKLLRKSLEKLKPDMLIVLGDLSGKSTELGKWLAIFQQFQEMLGPYMGLPLHIVLGDRDIGDCCRLDAKLVGQIASNLPGLDSFGSGAFEISNITFVSLNALALLCQDNDLRFGVEKVIERESHDFWSQMMDAVEEPIEPNENGPSSTYVNWKHDDMAPDSGPILLLHYPLHQTNRGDCGGTYPFEGKLLHNTFAAPSIFIDRSVPDVEPYEVLHSLPPNVTKYILQALKPRLIFSAHSHNFHCYTHREGTLEVTVPAMTWHARSEPGFILATFGQNQTVMMSSCFLAMESQVLLAYGTVFVLFMATALAANWTSLNNLVGF